MPNMSEIYRNLTGVDITKQQTLWDERGKGYYGEYLVFKELFPQLTGCCKILMNLQIPINEGKTTEIDLLLIHETGLYVFEVKHYKGTIYGKASQQKWTQYFRTSPNSHFYNPILQNQYHIQALQKMFPDLPIRSFIVFTNPECDLRIECNKPDITVCLLKDLRSSLRLLELRNKFLDINRIDGIFTELTPYSPLTDQSVTIEEESIPFYQYIDAIISDVRNEKNKAKTAYLAEETAARKKTRVTITIASIAVVLCIILSIISCSQYRAKANNQIAAAEKELSEFAQKFEHVSPYNNGNIVLADDFVTASDVQLLESVDVENAVNLQFTLNWNGEYYGISINRDTTIIVMLKDGSIKEYDLLESSFPYTSSNLHLGQGNVWYSAYSTHTFPVHELSGIKLEDIAYIKLSGINIWVTEDGGYKHIIIGSGYEIKIY